MADAVVEVRCPVGQRLFTKLHIGEYRFIQPDNLIEFACGDCAREMTRDPTAPRMRVLHRFNFIGELVDTVAVARD